jgi:replication-associated recombination protein RarA
MGRVERRLRRKWKAVEKRLGDVEERWGENKVGGHLESKCQIHGLLGIEHLNNEQHTVFDAVTEAYGSDHGGLFFIHGPGGCGKTFVYNLLAQKAHSENHIVLCVASSGIASLLLPLGATAHSTFKIQLAVCQSRES